MARVRWGILGCGNIATSAIAPAIRWSDNGELVAIGSRSLERARAKAEETGARAAYGSYEELLAAPDVDAVYIGLPNALHARWAIAAANAKKHVLCDKSLALTVADARAMREAARTNGVGLACGFMYRHHPQWTLVRSLLAEGAIGAVRHVRAVFRATLANPEDHRWTQGGALFDVTCYPVDAVRLVTGEEPTRVQATGDVANDDALLEFPSGAVASVHGSLRAPFEQSVVIAGERERIVLDRPFVPHWEPTEVRVGARVHHVPGANHFLHMIEHVARAFGDGSPLSPTEDGVADVEACCAISSARPSSLR